MCFSSSLLDANHCLPHEYTELTVWHLGGAEQRSSYPYRSEHSALVLRVLSNVWTVVIQNFKNCKELFKKKEIMTILAVHRITGIISTVLAKLREVTTKLCPGNYQKPTMGQACITWWSCRVSPSCITCHHLSFHPSLSSQLQPDLTPTPSPHYPSAPPCNSVCLSMSCLHTWGKGQYFHCLKNQSSPPHPKVTLSSSSPSLLFQFLRLPDCGLLGQDLGRSLQSLLWLFLFSLHGSPLLPHTINPRLLLLFIWFLSFNSYLNSFEVILV